MKLAVVEAGGKQFVAREGQSLEVDRMAAEVGQALDLAEVLLVVDGQQIQIGMPVVEGARVQARVVEHVKGPKIRVFKYIPKERYRRRQGHRQQYTRLAVERIVYPGMAEGQTAPDEAPARARPARAAGRAAAKAPARGGRKARKTG